MWMGLTCLPPLLGTQKRENERGKGIKKGIGSVPRQASTRETLVVVQSGGPSEIEIDQ
jgi:hypothetical protein